MNIYHLFTKIIILFLFTLRKYITFVIGIIFKLCHRSRNRDIDEKPEIQYTMSISLRNFLFESLCISLLLKLAVNIYWSARFLSILTKNFSITADIQKVWLSRKYFIFFNLFQHDNCEILTKTFAKTNQRCHFCSTTCCYYLICRDQNLQFYMGLKSWNSLISISCPHSKNVFLGKIAAS